MFIILGLSIPVFYGKLRTDAFLVLSGMICIITTMAIVIRKAID